jgi:hypothetical protein
MRQPLPVALQMVANLSTCEQTDSEALLRGKSEEVMLAITKVRLNVVDMENQLL